MEVHIGLVYYEIFFNISAEYLMFTLKESPNFFNCKTSFRGALLIKIKNSNDKFEKIPMNKKYCEQLIL